MPGRDSEPDFSRLSRRERQIFDVLIREETATLTEIIEQMEDPPTRQAVRALLVIMERKGYVKHEKSGREFVYQPTGSGETAARSMFRDLVQKLFGNSLKDALASHLEDESVSYSDEEIEEIAELFRQQQKKKKVGRRAKKKRP